VLCCCGQLRFVCGEPVDVEVFLSNPLKVPILIQHMSLSTSGVPFDAFTVSFTLPADTYHQRVLVSGLPRAPGTLEIRGVHIRSFNIMWEHRVDTRGHGIRPIYVSRATYPCRHDMDSILAAHCLFVFSRFFFVLVRMIPIHLPTVLLHLPLYRPSPRSMFAPSTSLLLFRV
jgi:hypothetical protein